MENPQTAKDKPDASIILATYNRADLVGKALESLAKQDVPEGFRYEIILVANNCTDNTQEVYEEVAQRYPGLFRYVEEPVPGLSSARNAGIRVAEGADIGFCDDDQVADPGWLWANVQCLRECDDAMGCGGPNLPLWECDRPEWLDDSLLAKLSVRELPWPRQPFPDDMYPFGGNALYRREVFDELGLYRTDLGRTEKTLFGGEETELAIRIHEAGGQLYYVPEAIMLHLVPADRLKKEYFRKLAHDSGKSGVLISRSLRSWPAYLWYLVKLNIKWLLGWLRLAVKPSGPDAAKAFATRYNQWIRHSVWRHSWRWIFARPPR